MKSIRIATRSSTLAMVQAHWVQSKLIELYPDITIDIIPFKTQGDIQLSQPLAKIGGKGLFVKELQQALLEDRADLAVHCVKDMPYRCAKGLSIAGIMKREDPSDAFVSEQWESLESLPKGAVIGTSSLRRMMHVKRFNPHLECRPLRGNVQTRLKKLQEGQYDAILLASAGLNRLGLSERIRERLSLERFIPAVGQGALGLEIRESDQTLHDLLIPLSCQRASVCVNAERVMNEVLEGSCSVSISGFAHLEGQTLSLSGMVGLPNGERVIEAQASMSVNEARALGQKVANALIQQDARSIFEQCKQYV